MFYKCKSTTERLNQLKFFSRIVKRALCIKLLQNTVQKRELDFWCGNSVFNKPELDYAVMGTYLNFWFGVFCNLEI